MELIVFVLTAVFIIVAVFAFIEYLIHIDFSKQKCLQENKNLYRINFKQFLKMFKSIKKWKREVSYDTSWFNYDLNKSNYIHENIIMFDDKYYILDLFSYFAFLIFINKTRVKSKIIIHDLRRRK